MMDLAAPVRVVIQIALIRRMALLKKVFPGRVRGGRVMMDPLKRLTAVAVLR